MVRVDLGPTLRQPAAFASIKSGRHRSPDVSLTSKFRGSYSSFNSLSLGSFRGRRLGHSIVVVIQDDELRNAISWALQLLGCRRAPAYSAITNAELAVLRAGPPDLILCDLELAIVVLTGLRGREAGAKLAAPVVLLCSKSFDRDQMSVALETGASGYITKPVRVQSVRAMALKYLGCPRASGRRRPGEEEVSIGADEVLKGAQVASVGAGFEKLKVIGVGTQGQVSLVRRKRDSRCFAVKEVNISRLNASEQRRVLNELRMHSSFDCPCIVRSFSSWLQGDSACLLMEYVDTSLGREVEKHRSDGTEIADDVIIDWAGQMLIGLVYLHHKDVLHRDLKLDNVLGPDDHSCVKLADFGISKQLREVDMGEMSLVGTPRIMAPERCPSAGCRPHLAHAGSFCYGSASDFWSLGVVLYELVALRAPFEAQSIGVLFSEIHNIEPFPLPTARSPVFHKVIVEGLLQKRKEDRMDAAAMCREPSIFKAIHSFLDRRGLRDEPSMVELLHVISGEVADECSTMDVIALHQSTGGSLLRSACKNPDVGLLGGSIANLGGKELATLGLTPMEELVPMPSLCGVLFQSSLHDCGNSASMPPDVKEIDEPKVEPRQPGLRRAKSTVSNASHCSNISAKSVYSSRTNSKGSMASKTSEWREKLASKVPTFMKSKFRRSRSTMSLESRDSKKTTHTTNTEQLFMDFEEALKPTSPKCQDPIVRQNSINSITAKGMQEHWILGGDMLKITDGGLLGSGSFGTLCKGELYGTPVAVKMPKRGTTRAPRGKRDGRRAESRDRSIHTLSNELRVLRHVWHPNIVIFYGAVINISGDIHLVLELLHGAQLDDFACRKGEHEPTVGTRHKLLLQICLALRYLHALDPCIVHGDLKGPNILVERWLSGPRAKLLDFGLSRVLTKHAKPPGGTLNWMAPEVIMNRTAPPAPSADVFSFGRLAYLLIVGKRPLCDMGFADIVRAAHESVLPSLAWPMSTMPLCADCRQLADECFDLLPHMRPSMEEIHDNLRDWDVDDDPCSAAMPNGPGMSWETGLISVRKGLCSMERPAGTVRRALASLGRQMSVSRHMFPIASGSKVVLDRIMLHTRFHGYFIHAQRVELMPASTLSVGCFGAVVPARLDSSLVVVRVPRGPPGDVPVAQLQAVLDELQVLLHMNHPNIVALHGLCFEEASSVVAPVLEWVEGIQLDDFVCATNPPADGSTRCRLLQDLCSSLRFLHDMRQPIVHGDLRGSNVLVELRLSGPGPRAKLLDFGLSRFLSKQGLPLPSPSTAPEWLVARRRQTLVYQAPEVLRSRRAEYTRAGDVFSVGRLSFLIVCGEQPLANVDMVTMEQAAKKSHVLRLTWPTWTKLHIECQHLATMCLFSNPLLRPCMGLVQAGVTAQLAKACTHSQETLLTTPRDTLMKPREPPVTTTLVMTPRELPLPTPRETCMTPRDTCMMTPREIPLPTPRETCMTPRDTCMTPRRDPKITEAPD